VQSKAFTLSLGEIRLLRFLAVRAPGARASISQDYWGDIKEDWTSGDSSGVQGQSPGRGSPQKLKLCVKFALKYNKQQLLSLESTF